MLKVFCAHKGTLDDKASARRLLAQAYSELFNEPLPLMGSTKQGKPFFVERPDIHVSLSHSGDYVLCALSDTSVGIDIEKMRLIKPGLDERVRSNEERTCFDFFSSWVLKESFIKWQGRYTQHFRHICFTGTKSKALGPNSKVNARVYTLIEGYRIGVCVSGQKPPRHIYIRNIVLQPREQTSQIQYAPATMLRELSRLNAPLSP